jgi:site-specific recombinase XerD
LVRSAESSSFSPIATQCTNAPSLGSFLARCSTARHNQHQRLIAFFYFCIGQGWIKENPAKRIKNVPAEQDETLPFTREQYEALLDAHTVYDKLVVVLQMFV